MFNDIITQIDWFSGLGVIELAQIFVLGVFILLQTNKKGPIPVRVRGHFIKE